MKTAARSRQSSVGSLNSVTTVCHSEPVIGVRTTGRIKKPKTVFDPSDNYLPRPRTSASTSSSLSPTSSTSSTVFDHRKKEIPATKTTKRSISTSPVKSNSNFSSPECVEGFCVICQKRVTKRNFNIKNKLLTCTECDRKVHKLCIPNQFEDYDLLRQHFKCDECRICEKCAEHNDINDEENPNFAVCVRCVKSYHFNCHKPTILRSQCNIKKWLCCECSPSISPVQMQPILPTRSKQVPVTVSAPIPVPVPVTVTVPASVPVPVKLTRDILADEARLKSQISMNVALNAQFKQKVIIKQQQQAKQLQLLQQQRQISKEKYKEHQKQMNEMNELSMSDMISSKRTKCRTNLNIVKDNSIPQTQTTAAPATAPSSIPPSPPPQPQLPLAKKIKIENNNTDTIQEEWIYPENTNLNSNADLLNPLYSHNFNPTEPIDLPDVKNWNVEQVYKFFVKYFPNEAHIFREHEIDGTSLLLLTRTDVLDQLPVPLGPSLRLYSLILRLQTRSNDPSLAWN